MFEDRRRVARRVGRAVKVMTRIAGMLTATVLAGGGCSLLPFGSGGGNGSAGTAPQAMRPALHEATPNRQADCIAEVTPAEVADIADGTPAAGAVDAPAAEPAAMADAPAAGCSACRCKSAGASETASAVRADGPPPVLTDAGGVIGFTPATVPAADDALQRLMDGNKRFVEGEPENVYRLAQRPGEQTRRPPAAMVLACSDWSIPPESAFDARAGELFVVRVAGNVADAAVVDSARYAIEKYDVPLIIVLGHEECDALGEGAAATDAEVQAVEGRTAAHAVDADGAPESDSPDRPTGEAARAVHANVEEVVAHLRRADPVLSARLASGKLKVVGACYDETNGQIALEAEKPAVPETRVTAVQAD